jgi:hypothetical protein
MLATSENSEYSVSFGRVARTIPYQDGVGILQFGFDVKPAKSPATGKWVLVLERKVLVPGGGGANPNRAEVAFARVKEYAISCGYEVVDFPD